MGIICPSACKTGILQLVHIVQIHKVTLMAAQELGMGFQEPAAAQTASG